jgi:hypothetical protein
LIKLVGDDVSKKFVESLRDELVKMLQIKANEHATEISVIPSRPEEKQTIVPLSTEEQKVDSIKCSDADIKATVPLSTEEQPTKQVDWPETHCPLGQHCKEQGTGCSKFHPKDPEWNGPHGELKGICRHGPHHPKFCCFRKDFNCGFAHGISQLKPRSHNEEWNLSCCHHGQHCERQYSCRYVHPTSPHWTRNHCRNGNHCSHRECWYVHPANRRM